MTLRDELQKQDLAVLHARYLVDQLRSQRDRQMARENRLKREIAVLRENLVSLIESDWYAHEPRCDLKEYVEREMAAIDGDIEKVEASATQGS